jgi:alpha-L-fucosidase
MPNSEAEAAMKIDQIGRRSLLQSAFGALVARFAPPAAAQTDPADPYANETAEERDARMKWWREARFGMFVHWGVYSVPAGTYHGRRIGGIGEWIMNTAKIPCAEYQQFAKQFNPVKYDADAWVRTAKDAGMKYIVITSKHHDGFAMFDSKASNWNIVKASPFGRDPLKELAAACRKHGIRLGFYYSQAQDWNNPGGAAAGGHWDPAQNGSMDDYIKNVAVPQVREILTHYGKISVLWWDTPIDMNHDRAAELISVLKLQPGIIHNNRLGGGFRGDTETPEQYVPATGFPGRDWETCMTMNDTWGYKSYDDNWKSSETIIHNLVDIASKGGNYLLNVGPTNEGVIPAPSIERLRAVGSWMRSNGQAIYGTSASPFKKLPWGRCTRKERGDETTLYLHVFNWPADGRLVVPGLKSDVIDARLLRGGRLKTSSAADGVTIEVPAMAPDPISSTVALRIKGPVTVENKVTTQAADGTLLLRGADAEVHGDQLQYESGDGKDNLGYWMNPADYAEWAFEVKTPGRFHVSAEIAAQGSGAFVIRSGDSFVKGTAPNTGSYTKFTHIELGTIELPGAGRTTLTVKPVAQAWQPMNLKSIYLTPVK